MSIFAKKDPLQLPPEWGERFVGSTGICCGERQFMLAGSGTARDMMDHGEDDTRRAGTADRPRVSVNRGRDAKPCARDHHYSFRCRGRAFALRKGWCWKNNPRRGFAPPRGNSCIYLWLPACFLDSPSHSIYFMIWFEHQGHHRRSLLCPKQL